MDPSNEQEASQKNKLHLSLDLRIITLLLLVVIIGLLIAWRPWATIAESSDNVIEVTGETTLTDTPDEYVFYPSYQFKNEDRDAALAQLTEKSKEVVDGLKQLGVEDNKIKTNSNGHGLPYYPDDRANSEATYNLQLTVTVADNELAQKVQDYLLTTTPSGNVTPQANFSDAKRNQLENKARDEATKDARSKADQMANNLGFKVGRVKSVSDNSGFGIYPFSARDSVSSNAELTSPELNLQPGENDLSYSVTVVYYIR